ncbi:MAG: TAXI family TRAP transporter solute-binding subunit [Proteobacteria bacterium]|nr:TAXI family TRAP transporter solute-binding subunit [Pseudomonadota bacterium]
MRTMSVGLRCLLGAAAVMLVLPAPAGAMEAKKPARVSISVGPPGTPWSIAGAGMLQIFKKNGVDGTTELGGGVANPITVSHGRTYMGFTMAANMPLAIRGEDPYKEKITNIRGVHLAAVNAVHVLARKETGVKQIADLAGQKFVTQPVGNTTTLSFELLMKATGIDGKVELSRGSQDFGSNQTKDRKVAGFTATTDYPAAAFAETFQTLDVLLLPVPDDVLNKVLAMNNGYFRHVIPANTYPHQPTAVPTMATAAFMITRAENPAEEVYWIVKTLIENLDDVRALHASFKNITPKEMATVPAVPLHPGAEAYYKEKGLL